MKDSIIRQAAWLDISVNNNNAQRNDWKWFKETWDSKMCEEHHLNWGGVFAEWTQQVVDNVTDGMPNAFSVFMEAETRRNFKDNVMLVLPPTLSG